jgi:hypothetical protein
MIDTCGSGSIPKEEDIVAGQIVDIPCSLQKHQLWYDSNRLQIQGKSPQNLSEK